MTKVKDYIYKDISSVNENSTIYRVIKYMKLHRISAVPVVNQLGEYVGCISEDDILKASVPEYMKSIYNTSFMADLDRVSAHLKDILDKKAITVSDKSYPFVTPNDSMSYAADLLYRSCRNMLPVVEGKTLIGMVTRIEILSATLND
jgi:predicted transcriptional regulator